jgi:hypothetical protein
MKKLISNEKVISTLKNVFNYILIVGGLLVGYIIGKHSTLLTPKIETNPYTNIHTTKTISIAVNDKNELLLIDKTNGEYHIYSDSVGMNIFKMYTHRIYQTVTTHE